MQSAKKTYDGKIAGLYDLEETLGRGHFAVVKLARHVFTGEKVAVKVIDKTKLDEVSRAHLFQEVRCMKLVQHPNVVRLYEVIDTQTKLYLILELGDGGDLYDYIMKHEAGLGEEMAKEYFRQIVRAISYCHQLHVVHRDLKPENVVFFERLGVVKLTDFGFSNKFCPGQKLETSCGSLAYSAPEILLGDSYDAPAVDVWSLGVILYMLVVGQAPFQEANDSETLTKIMDCKYTIPTHVSDACKRLIARMLIREPESRATLEDIASDPWLGGPPQVEYLPLVSRHQVTEDDHNIIINKMVNGNIATKEEVLEALDKNEYNHITATYFLLAERKLRAHRQEQAQNRIKQNQILVNLASNSKNSLKSTATESANDSLQLPTAATTTSVLNVPRTPGDTPQGRVRKCSIVQEEEDEEEYCGVVGSGQELTPPHSSLNRRGSRSEGKLNIAVQERIAEERRKEKKESPNASPHPSSMGRVAAKDDTTCYGSKRSSPTTIHSGIPASYIPGSTKWRMGTNKKSQLQQNSSVESKKLDLECESELGKLNEGNRKVTGESPKKVVASSVRTKDRGGESNKKSETEKKVEKVIISSQVQSPSRTSLKRENSDLTTVSLTDSATVTIPLHPSQMDQGSYQKYKTMPSPTRISVLSSPSLQLNEIFEEGVSDFTTTGESKPGESRATRIVNYEQRKSRFHKNRTASCSSSDASDDDSESRKKRAHKISTEKNNQRRDSHDDSSDSQDKGGSGGVGGNPPAGFGSGGDGMHNQSPSNGGRENHSSESGENTGNGNNRNQRQCNGENFRRNRRRTGETRLRESQSLNRITEVQESEAHSFTVTTTEIFHERLRKHTEKDKNPSESNMNNNNVVLTMEKGKSGKSSVARLLQSWSNTISSTTKLTVNKRKYLPDGRSQRDGRGTGFSNLNDQIQKDYSDEKENKVLVEKSGKKVKLLGRYFQVSKKLCIPLPSLVSKGRLYKARSCGSIARDRITSPMTSGSSTYKPNLNGVIKSPAVYFEKCKSPTPPIMNQSLDSIDSNAVSKRDFNRDVTRPLKKSPNKMLKSVQSKIPNGNGKNEMGGGAVKAEIVVVNNICGNASSVTEAQYEIKNSKGDINKNLSNCPKDGICQMHMRDAAKCHLS